MFRLVYQVFWCKKNSQSIEKIFEGFCGIKGLKKSILSWIHLTNTIENIVILIITIHVINENLLCMLSFDNKNVHFWIHTK